MSKKNSPPSPPAERTAALKQKIFKTFDSFSRDEEGLKRFVALLEKAWSEDAENDPALKPGLVSQDPMRMVIRKYVPDYHPGSVLDTPLFPFPPDHLSHPFDHSATGAYFAHLGFSDQALSHLGDDLGQFERWLDEEYHNRNFAYIMQRVHLLAKDSSEYHWDFDPAAALADQDKPFCLMQPNGIMSYSQTFQNGRLKDLCFADLDEAKHFARQAIGEMDYPILIGLRLKWYSWY